MAPLANANTRACAQCAGCCPANQESARKDANVQENPRYWGSAPNLMMHFPENGTFRGQHKMLQLQKQLALYLGNNGCVNYNPFPGAAGEQVRGTCRHSVFYCPCVTRVERETVWRGLT